ncbi:MAG: FAD-dependent oxidoreductase [Gemmatimonadota bacterium]
MAPPSGLSVLVVGAGLVGRSAAYYLCREGAAVRLVDADADPSSASRASLGVLTHCNGGDDAYGTLYRDGHALHRGLAEELRAETGTDPGWRALGGIDLVVSDDDEAEARRDQELNRARGCPAEWLSAAAVRDLEPGVAGPVRGGLYFPGDHRVDPGRLAAALLTAVRRGGARVDLGTAVESLEPGSGGTVRAHLRTGGVTEQWVADFAVLAAGAWSDQLAVAGGVDLAVRPVRGQQARYRSTAVPRHVLRLGGYHAVPAGDQVVVGATVEEVGFDSDPTSEAGAEFDRAIASMLSGPAVRLEQRAGLRPKPRKGRPVIGPLPGWERVMVATGHYKSGVLLGPITGLVVARWITGGQPGRDMQHFAVRR